MPDTVDDFIKRFGGEGTVDDTEANQVHDRFVSSAPEDQEFDTQHYQQGAAEYLGKLPDDEFKQAAKKSFTQIPQQDQQSLINTLLGAISSEGGPGDLRALGSSLGLSSTNPQQMSPDDYARLANYTRHESPETMQKIIQEKPWWLKALGHPVLMGALGMVASKMLRSRFNK